MEVGWAGLETNSLVENTQLTEETPVCRWTPAYT